MNLRPLQYITPSSFRALSACFLQAAFRADASYVTFQPPAVRLGTACHALLERVAKGALLDVPPDAWQDGLESIWLEEVHIQERTLLVSEQERHFGRAETWPKYALQKARVFVKAQKLLRYQFERRENRMGYGRSASERPYHAYNGRLRGRVDVVYESSRGVELIDYKTGNILDEAESGDTTIKETYKQQLLLYAAMHHDYTGVWPVRGHVVPLTGKPITIEIHPVAAEYLAQSALQQMALFNERISQITQTNELASPSYASCRYCAYKVYCPAFWEFSFVPSEWDSVAHLEMAIKQATSWRDGVKFSAQVIAGTLPIGTYTGYSSRPDNFAEGQQVRVINMQSKNLGETLKIHDHSTIYVLSSVTLP
jgi:RecB family exonuclease